MAPTTTATTTAEENGDMKNILFAPIEHTDSIKPSNGNGSLTYSAASSINSAGESTDSSFADIMRVLDGHEGGSKELAAYLKREAARTTDEKSIAGESLAYSTDAESQMMKSLATDAESALQGADLLSTITG